jgi:hypothetical protein
MEFKAELIAPESEEIAPESQEVVEPESQEPKEVVTPALWSSR